MDGLKRCRVCGFVFASAGRRPHSSSTSASAVLPFAPDTVLRGRYRLVRYLGSGAHGVTYLAHHEFLDHPCVVKVLPVPMASPSDVDVRRFRAEASAGLRVNHPNVVRVLDGDSEDNIWYFVMEYAEGINLAQTTIHGVRTDWRQALEFAVDVARGLEAIHEAGLVHLDVKPANLILGPSGRLRLTDFGVARLIHACPRFSRGQSDVTDGTLEYAAPEVIERRGNISPTADLYSLGATLFELLHGKPPRGYSIYQTLLATNTDRVAWPRDNAGEMPRWFREAIERLLDPDPRRRFPSARALIEFLEDPSATPAATPQRAPSAYPEPRGLVVMPFENASAEAADEWLGHAVADHLARSLARLEGAFVVDVEQFLHTLDRIARRDDGSQGQQLRQAGRLSGAASVITGRFIRKGDQIVLSAQIYHVRQPRNAVLPQVEGPLASLARIENGLVEEIAGQLGLNPAEPATTSGPSRNLLAAEKQLFSARRAFLSGDYETAMRQGRKALDLDGDYGEALGFVGACCARTGRYDDAADYQRRLEQLADRIGDQRLKVQAHANMGSMHYFRGDYEHANACLSEAAAAAETLGLTTELAQIRNNLGFVLLQLGRQVEAGRTFASAVETLGQYGALVALIGPYNGLGHVRREQKRFEEARHYFHKALALAQECDDTVNMGIAFMNLGHCALLQGRLADAKHELAVALNILEKTSFWNGLARVYEYMTTLNLRRNNIDQAIQCVDKRIELARRHANRRMEADARGQKAEVLRAARQGTATDTSPTNETTNRLDDHTPSTRTPDRPRIGRRSTSRR